MYLITILTCIIRALDNEFKLRWGPGSCHCDSDLVAVRVMMSGTRGMLFHRPPLGGDIASNAGHCGL